MASHVKHYRSIELNYREMPFKWTESTQRLEQTESMLTRHQRLSKYTILFSHQKIEQREREMRTTDNHLIYNSFSPQDQEIFGLFSCPPLCSPFLVFVKSFTSKRNSDTRVKKKENQKKYLPRKYSLHENSISNPNMVLVNKEKKNRISCKML